MTTRTQIDVNLHDTTVRSECRRIIAGRLPEYCAVLRWDSTELELFGALEDLEGVLDSLAHDLACLRSQQAQDEAKSA